MFDYVYMLRNANELDSTVVNQYLDVTNDNEYKLEKNIKLIYEFSIQSLSKFYFLILLSINFIMASWIIVWLVSVWNSKSLLNLR